MDARKMFSLTGKTVLVTGASSGIGAHLARLVSQAGARVVIGARHSERLKQLAQDIHWLGGEVMIVALDVTERASVDAAFDAAEASLGVVDVVLNNAGVGNGMRTLEIAEED